MATDQKTYRQLITERKSELADIMKTPEHLFTKAQADRVDALATELTDLEAKSARYDAAKEQADRMKGEERSEFIPGTMIPNTPGAMHPDEERFLDASTGNGTKAEAAKTAGERWAEKSLHKVREAMPSALKATMTFSEISVQDPLLTAYSQLPTTPSRLLDLIPVVSNLSGTRYEFLRQLNRTNNASPVGDGDLKPLSDMMWFEDEVPYEVIANGADVINRVLTDYPRLIKILGNELQYGLVKTIEDQVLNGTGVRPNLRGILHTTGVQDLPFDTDVPTTLRKAHLAMELGGEEPTAYVMHPEDILALELAKDGQGRYMDWDNFFPVRRVSSALVPKGTAFLGDWRSTALLVREDTSTLAFEQHKDYAQRNMTYIRVEGRYAFFVQRPSALAKIKLTA